MDGEPRKLAKVADAYSGGDPQRLRAIFYVALIWATYAIMQEITWPSRSYLLGIIATLACAWLLIVFVTRLIKSQFLRKLVRWAAWTYVTLDVLGLSGEAPAGLIARGSAG